MRIKKSVVKKSVPVLAEKGISQSGLNRFLECRRKAQLAVEGWNLKRKSGALRFGSIWHSCLEYCYTLPSTAAGKSPTPEDVLVLRKRLVKEYEGGSGLASAEEMQETALDIEVAITILKAYLLRYPKDFSAKKWVGIEEKFELPYKGKTLLGFLDGTYELGTSRKETWLMETKTKGRIMESMVDMLHFDFQSLYYIHLYFLKHRVFPTGVLYNIVRKPQLKRSVKEGLDQFCARLASDLSIRPEFYFLRYEIGIPKEEYDKWIATELDPILEDYWKWGVEEGCTRSYKNTTQCETKYGACMYLPICSTGNYEPFEKRKSSGRK